MPRNATISAKWHVRSMPMPCRPRRRPLLGRPSWSRRLGPSWRRLPSVLWRAENWRIFFDQNGKDAGQKLEKYHYSWVTTAPRGADCGLQPLFAAVITSDWWMDDADRAVVPYRGLEICPICPVQSLLRCTKCNSPLINGQCTNLMLFDEAL